MKILKIINDLFIDSFKGIEKLKLDKCGDINIIVGDNNTCKTTVLEAIQCLQYPNDFRELIKVIRKRYISTNKLSGITVLESFLNVFNAEQKESEKKVKIRFIANDIENIFQIQGEVKEVYITENELLEMTKYQRIKDDQYDEEVPVKEFRGNIEYNDKAVEVFINEVTDIYRYGENNSLINESIFEINYLSSVDHVNERFSTRIISNAIKNNEKSGLLDLLKLFDNNIIGLEILPVGNGNRSITHIEHKKYGFMPVASFGDGLKKVLALASIILSTQNGVVLIDEIETAIHTSALSKVFQWLMKVAEKQNIQIFATTHSEEALRNFLENNENFNLDICIYRLENVDGDILARRFSGKKATRIIIENGGDLR